VYALNEGDLDQEPAKEECFPLHNPCDYFGNALWYCVTDAGISQHHLTINEIHKASDLLKQVGSMFTKMNICLPPIFHAATHICKHLLWHGHGVLEATMVKGFLCHAESYHYVKIMQSIEDPTDDNIKTTSVLLSAMWDGPEHEIQHGMLDVVLAESDMGSQAITMETKHAMGISMTKFWS
ncbi:hypothetical protein FRC11_008326, partial [Ceratobasidium sp. 423]